VIESHTIAAPSGDNKHALTMAEIDQVLQRTSTGASEAGSPLEEGIISAIKGYVTDAVVEITDVAGVKSSRLSKERPERDFVAMSNKDVEHILKLMPYRLRETACSEVIIDKETGEESHAWRSIKNTTMRELGEYGTGIRLYFELLKMMGVLYLVCFVITFPTLVMCLMGNYMADNPETKEMERTLPPALNMMTKTMISNLGHWSCPSGEEDCELPKRTDRGLSGVGADVLRVRDATFVLGMLDSIATMLVLLFCLFFLHVWIPKRAKKHDEIDSVTAADFAIDVFNLPEIIGESKTSDVHKRYEQELAEHFKNVIHKHGKKADAARADDPVHEVALQREYDGHVESFIQIAHLRNMQQNLEAKQRIATSRSKKEKYGKQAEATAKKVADFDNKMGAQAQVIDEERGVCGAVVMFKSQKLKDIVLEVYGPYRNWLARQGQPEDLQFRKTKIYARQACEPADLYWENLDYGWAARMGRQAFVGLITLSIICLCTVLLSNLRAYKVIALPSRDEQQFFVLGPDPADASQGKCIDLCSFELFEHEGCLGDPLPVQSSLARDYVSGSAPLTVTGLDQDYPLVDDCSLNHLPSPGGRTCVPYISYGFDKKVVPHCIKVKVRDGVASHANATSTMALYGCPEHEDHAVLPNLERCQRMMNPFLAHTRWDKARAQSFIKLDTSCLLEVTAGQAAAARERALKEDRSPVADITVSCYCQQRVAKDRRFERLKPEARQDGGACKEFIANSGMLASIIVQAGSIICVSLMNLLLNQIVFPLDMWTKPRTLTGLCMSSMNKLFMALFVNTGVVLLLVSADFHGGAFFNTISHGPISKLGKGPFSDLSGAWFATSGADFFATCLSNGFAMSLGPLVWSFVFAPVLIRIRRIGLVTEAMLREVYMMPEWPFATRLAQTVWTLFCVAMYSGGMPLLYLVGATYCYVSYWVDKACLLRGARKPPVYNEELVKQAVQWIILGMSVHVGITSMMYGFQDIFPSSYSSLVGAYEVVFGMTESEADAIMIDWTKNYKHNKYPHFRDYVRARMLDMSRWGCVSVSLGLLSFVLYFIYILLWKTLVRPWKCSRNRVRKAQDFIHAKVAGAGEAPPVNQDVDIDDAIEKHGHSKLLSYKMEANPKYKPAYEALMYAEDDEDPEQKGALSRSRRSKRF